MSTEPWNTETDKSETPAEVPLFTHYQNALSKQRLLTLSFTHLIIPEKSKPIISIFIRGNPVMYITFPLPKRQISFLFIIRKNNYENFP